MRLHVSIRQFRVSAHWVWFAMSSLFVLGAIAFPALAEPPLSLDAERALLARGAAFITAVNDTTVAARKAALPALYAQETLRGVPEEKLLGLFQRLHENYAPLEYHHSEITRTYLHVFARKRGTTQWQDFQFRFEAAPPHGLLTIVFIAEVSEPVYLPNGSLEAPETLAWLNGYIDKLIHDDDLSGAVLLAKGDQIIFERHFGYQDLERSKPVTPETRFGLGSGNKMFTALAIMSLVQEGRLRLDQTIETFFPDFPDPALARKITIRHLLSHSSGLGDYWTKDFEREGWRATRIEEIVPFVYAEFRANGPHFAPGAEHRYSNSGFLLLGRILEKVAGQDYYDLIRARIYKPLGMSRTDHYLTDGSVPGLATPLNRAPVAPGDSSGTRRWAEARRGLRGTSAGGGFSTCADILRYARALVGGRIVTLASLTAMTEPQPPLDPAEPEEYGLGFLLGSSKGGVRSFGHGGIAGGVNFELRYFPGEDITVIAFSNQDNGAYDDLRKNIIRLITGDR